MRRATSHACEVLTQSTRPALTPISSARPSIRTRLPLCFGTSHLRRASDVKNGIKVENTRVDDTKDDDFRASTPTRGHKPDNNVNVFKSWLQRLVDAASKHERGDAKKFPAQQVASGLRVHCLSMMNGYLTIGVQLDEPKGCNNLSSSKVKNLTAIFNEISRCEIVKGVCWLPSTGPIFCAGANVKELSNLNEPEPAETFIRGISDLCAAIRKVPVPVVALVHGPCVGAGLEVAASCDIRVCTHSANFSMPEVLVRLPSVVQARLLCDIVGWGRARHLMLTGCTWNAQEAFQAGLVTKTFSSIAEMMQWAHKYMNQISNGEGRNEYRAQKLLINAWESQTVDEGIEAGVRCFVDHVAQGSIGKSVASAFALERSKTHNSTVSGFRRLRVTPQAQDGLDSPREVSHLDEFSPQVEASGESQETEIPDWLKRLRSPEKRRSDSAGTSLKDYEDDDEDENEFLTPSKSRSSRI